MSRAGMLILMAVCGMVGCSQSPAPQQLLPDNDASAEKANKMSSNNENLEVATFGSGCFWCTEAVFRELIGVESVTSGYSGGSVLYPTYYQVTTGNTGHAEVIQVKFDPAKINYSDLLRVFWQTHDPTTLNRQGADVGTQYRSIVFYHSDEQKQIAEAYKKQLNESGDFKDPVVTQVEEFQAFFPAEDYHQEYFERNPQQGYCLAVVRPKVEKFKKEFADLLKENAK